MEAEPTIDQLLDRYTAIRQRIADAATRAGRRGQEVLLVAVTKHADPEQVRALIEAGHRDFGENRVQHLVQQAAMVEEYFQRLKVLPAGRRQIAEQAAETLFPASGSPRFNQAHLAGDRPVRWHMIGHLQRNKARRVTDFVRLVHSVDSLRLAEELQQIAVKRDQPIDVLVQVNCSGEESKFGCPIPAAIPLAEQIDTMLNVRVRGVMTMAEHGIGEARTRATFSRCRDVFDEMKRAGVGEGRLNILSMGMSGDYEWAIEEGANIVRVGSAIFGERQDVGEPEELA